MHITEQLKINFSFLVLEGKYFRFIYGLWNLQSKPHPYLNIYRYSLNKINRNNDYHFKRSSLMRPNTTPTTAIPLLCLATAVKC